jgi:hypothetical protein
MVTLFVGERVGVTVFFWRVPEEFCWHESFAGATFASKTAPAKFKMHQQNFRCASKTINPT